MRDSEQLELIDVFWERLRAADAPALRRRRLRSAALAAAAVAALAVPAWATGLLGHAFPKDKDARLYEHINAQRGDRYQLAAGRLQTGDPWSIVAYRAAVPSGTQRPRSRRFHTTGGACVQLRVNRRRGHGRLELLIECTTPKELQNPVLWLSETIGAGGDLRMGLLPANVALVHVTYASGRHLDVRPNRFDPAALRASGFRFAFSYFALMPPRGERFKGLVAVDEHGRVVGRVRHPTPTPPGTRTISSPALLADLPGPAARDKYLRSHRPPRRRTP